MAYGVNETRRVRDAATVTGRRPALQRPARGPRRLSLRILALLLPAVFAAGGLSADEASRRYGFGGADTDALALYRQGWIEILEYGRWTEAERLYRETVAADPDFIVAKSVLARITSDTAERNRLFEEVRSRLDEVDDDGRLLLVTYQKTLELFAARETGDTAAPEARAAMARRAVNDYGRFLEKYPDEWSVMIEYVEWIHALEGPAAALAEIERLREARGSATSFGYFPAWFHAELGQHDTARRLASAFTRRIDDASSPQPHYLNAYLAFSAGDLDAARLAIARALALDPGHLLARRLQNTIAAAREAAVD